MKIPEVESWYEWKEFKVYEGDTEPRLGVPRVDPHEYEYAIDFIFEGLQEAVDFLVDWEIEPEEYKDWVLCKVTTEPLDFVVTDLMLRKR